MIRLFWFNLNTNFGDQLSPLLCSSLSGQKVSHTTDFRNCDLTAIGSILHLIQKPLFRGSVWGTGFIEPPQDSAAFSHARIHAVRGHLTREILGCDAGLPVGDPGLLADTLIPRPEKKYPLGLVPHFTDAGNPLVQQLLRRYPRIALIDVMQPVTDTIAKIAQCHAVLSSSLHGLIVADSFGIPSHWLKLSDNLIGGDFKFRDYYSIFGIHNPHPLTLTDTDTIESLLPKIGQYSRPGIEQIKTRLVESFPFKKRKKFFFW